MNLTEIATPVLTSLLEAVEGGRLHVPLSRASLLSLGYASAGESFLEVARDLPADAVVTILRVALAERAHRPPPRLDLVWTGPEARVATARDTAVLVSELFAGARKHVLIAGFSFDHGARILAPLHAVMRDHAVRVDVFLDFGEPTDTPAVPIRRFLARNWPFGPPFPALHYDPRTMQAEARASLHAKCIVVDGKQTLITSANFTDRGHTRNVELGVLIEDGELAGRVVSHWGALLHEGIFATARLT